MKQEGMVTLKVLEKFSIGNTAYYKDEVRAVPREVAETACEHGWAEDVSGEIKTGERSTVPKTLNVKKARAGHKETSPGGQE